MICFLTSRTDIKETGEVNPANGFVEELMHRVPNPCHALFTRFSTALLIAC